MPLIRVADDTRNAMLDAITALIDAGAAGGTIKIYNGTIPADADDAIVAQTLLATLTFTDPAAGSAAAGVLTFSAITSDVSADASGTAKWARLEDSDGNNILDCDVTVIGGGGAIELDTTNIVAGGTVALTAFTITAPASS